jgi:fructokinase
MRIGIDLGGTKIEVVALDGCGAVLYSERMPTPAGDYSATVAGIAALVAAAERSTGRRGSVGIGTPGTISQHSGLIKNSNSVCLNGQPLDRDLAALLGRPVRLSNDANCFALSEATDGAAVGASVVFGVIVGTGTGGGVVVDGRVLHGCNGIAGEWGHNPLPWPRDDERPGPACYCGKRGCIETFLCGPGFAADHRRSSGVELAPPAIVAQANAGEPQARATLARYHDRMARALASVINILDPDVVVLGGGMSNLASLYEHVPKLWRQYVISDEVRTRLVAAQHGDASGVRGAAWLWPPQD